MIHVFWLIPVLLMWCVATQVLPFGHGLEQKSKEDYIKEWLLYTGFCRRRGEGNVPGKDTPWNVRILRQYLEWRSRRCNVRTLAGVKSKLKHCSLCFDHLLPTAKGETPASLRLQLALITKDIGKRQKREYKAAGKSYDPKRSLALGRVDQTEVASS